MQSSAEKSLVLLLLRYMIGLKSSRHLFNQSDVQKPIVNSSHASSRALGQSHVTTSCFDWFTRLPVSFVIGYFVLDFDIELKISLCCAFDKS